jgi:hypothetical protein
VSATPTPEDHENAAGNGLSSNRLGRAVIPEGDALDLLLNDDGFADADTPEDDRAARPPDRLRPLAPIIPNSDDPFEDLSDDPVDTDPEAVSATPWPGEHEVPEQSGHSGPLPPRPDRDERATVNQSEGKSMMRDCLPPLANAPEAGSDTFDELSDDTSDVDTEPEAVGAAPWLVDRKDARQNGRQSDHLAPPVISSANPFSFLLDDDEPASAEGTDDEAAALPRDRLPRPTPVIPNNDDAFDELSDDEIL